MTAWLAGGVLMAAVGLTGCSKGATITGTAVGGTPFCVDAGKFQAQAQALEAAAGADLGTLQQQMSMTRDVLVKLQGEAPADKVNGHPLKGDITTVVDVYGALAAQLQGADPKDPQAVTKALAGVQAKDGESFTQAADRLDAYTKQVCKISVSAAVTTIPVGASTTSVSPIGPGVTPAPGAPTPAPPASSPPGTSAP